MLAISFTLALAMVKEKWGTRLLPTSNGAEADRRLAEILAKDPAIGFPRNLFLFDEPEFLYTRGLPAVDPRFPLKKKQGSFI